MRILVTVPWWERLGGAEAMLHTILEGAPDGRHEFELVFFRDGPWPEELRRAGLRVQVIEAGRVRELHRVVSTTRRLAALMRERRPDVILNWAAKTQLYGSPAALLAGMSDRVVWWQHSIAGRHWLDLLANLLPARTIACYSTAAATAQERLWPHRPTVVIAAGAAAVARAEADRGAPELSDPSEDSPGDGQESKSAIPLVGIVGRLQPWKGQDRLLRAHALLRESGQRMHLIIVGGDSYGLSPEYARSLPRLIEQLGLRDAVTLTGEVPDATPYVERMDVLVNASDPEPFGIVLLEAMAASVPVVAVDSGGPRDIVEDRRTGILARSGEPPDLAAALKPLLESAALRHALGDAGHERYLRDYTGEAVRRRFFTALEKVASDGR